MDDQPAPSPWWSRPALRADPAAYRRTVTGANARDGFALRERASASLLPSVDLGDFFAQIAPLSIYSEDVGGYAAEALLAQGVPAPLRARLIRAMWDEIRHSDLFFELCTSFDVDLSTSDIAPVDYLVTVLDEAETSLEFALLHTELEAQALELFNLFGRCLPPSVARSTFRVVATDETTHVALGLEIVTHMHDKGLRIDPERCSQLFSAADSISVLKQPEALSPVASALGTSTSSLHQRLVQRQDLRRSKILTLANEGSRDR